MVVHHNHNQSVIISEEATGGDQDLQIAIESEDVETLVDYPPDGSVKPPYSYATLICMAMKANKNKMTLNSIYKWIKENFVYYQNADPSWQVKINHHPHFLFGTFFSSPYPRFLSMTHDLLFSDT